MTEQQPIRILLIEDSIEDAQVLREALAADANIVFHLEHVDRLSSGLKRLTTTGADIVLLDLVLPDSHGVETVVALRRVAPQVPVVVLTASDDDALALQALQRGAQDYLVKGYVQVYRRLLGRSIRYAIERKRAEEEVRSAHARTEQLLSSIPSLLIEVSASGIVTHWNDVAHTTLGIASAAALDRRLAECGVRWETDVILEAIDQCRSSGNLVAMDDVPFAHANGQEGFLGLTFIPMKGGAEAEPPKVLLFGADVTQRKQAEMERSRLQEQLVQAQKMETVGRFAGGISHDFNNFLQAILGFAWLIHARHQEDPKLVRDVQEIVHAAESASAMIRQLLAFSRKQPLQPIPLDLNQTIRKMERLLQQLVGEHIRIDLRLAPHPLVANMDATAIEQILMNLAANARDSMLAGGTLTIHTESVNVNQAFLETRPWWKSTGQYVQLSIQDTGTGMDPATASRIFEPFFTTKQSGRGAGLGLAVVYGLVQQHAGFIDIETAIGHGTVFHLYFPHLAVPADASVRVLAGSAGSQRGGVAVVVAEDHEQQRALDAQVLLDAGYRIVGVCPVADALDLLNSGTDEVEVVVVEIPMPGDHSEEMIRRVQSARPAARLLLITGTVDARCRALESSLRNVRILQRPYVPMQLLNQLQQLLEQSAPVSLPERNGPSMEPIDHSAKPHVLIVDDDQPIRMLCERILQDSCSVTTASCGSAALEALERQEVDLVLTDLRMPNMDGVTLLTEVSKRRSVPKMLAMTGSLTDDMEQRLRSVSLSAEVIHKPFTAPTLLQAVNRALSNRAPSG